MPTGFTHLDRLTLGWQPSDLIISAARPSMGKTVFVLSLARNVAVDFEKRGCLLLARNERRAVDDASDRRRVGTRLARRAQRTVDARAVEASRIVDQAVGRCALFIDDTPALSIYEFRSKVRRLKTQYDINW